METNEECVTDQNNSLVESELPILELIMLK